MTMPTRSLLASLGLCFLWMAACGGGTGAPTAPSSTGSGGAMIAGTVSGAAPGGLTVAVTGTSLSAAVESTGSFQMAGVPSGNVQLQFRSPSVNATAQIANVANDELVQIQVQLNGSTASIVSEVRSAGKVLLCHRTESGTYQSIDVSVSAEPAHRAHGDAKIGEAVPGDPTKVFDRDCRPTGPAGASVSIRKFTNGQDANDPPGPSINVGTTVTWTYLVTNTGSVTLGSISVVDDRGVPVLCITQPLAAGQSMTCSGSGLATLGQYRNVGTVTATWTGGTVTAFDPSHYLGVGPAPEEAGPKVQLCHRTGNGSYHLIEVSINAEPAHRAHGDAKIGEAVPGNAGKVFGAGCSVN